MKPVRLLIIEDEPGRAGFIGEAVEKESLAVDIAGDDRSDPEPALCRKPDLIRVDS